MSRGFHPSVGSDFAAYWTEALGGPTTYSDSFEDETSIVRIQSGNGSTAKWIAARSIASIWLWPMKGWAMIAPEGVAQDENLKRRTESAIAFVKTLPAQRFG